MSKTLFGVLTHSEKIKNADSAKSCEKFSTYEELNFLTNFLLQNTTYLAEDFQRQCEAVNEREKEINRKVLQISKIPPILKALFEKQYNLEKEIDVMGDNLQHAECLLRNFENLGLEPDVAKRRDAIRFPMYEGFITFSKFIENFIHFVEELEEDNKFYQQGYKKIYPVGCILSEYLNILENVEFKLSAMERKLEENIDAISRVEINLF